MDLSVSLAALLRKMRKSLYAGDMLKCTICFQKCATRSLERDDSLACVCEERFLRKGRGKSYFTFKSYCQDRTYWYMPFIFYWRPVAIWFAGDFLQCLSILSAHRPKPAHFGLPHLRNRHEFAPKGWQVFPMVCCWWIRLRSLSGITFFHRLFDVSIYSWPPYK